MNTSVAACLILQTYTDMIGIKFYISWNEPEDDVSPNSQASSFSCNESAAKCLCVCRDKSDYHALPW